MNETKEYLSVTETAKRIRKSLAHNFPGVKFSVRSSSYAGGASITVDYTDGPALDKVRLVAKKFEGADFDAMTDCKNYQSNIEVSEAGMKEVHYGSDYVFVNRHVSWVNLQEVAFRVATEWGFEFDGTEQSFQNCSKLNNGRYIYLTDWTYREADKLDFLTPTPERRTHEQR